MKCKLQNISHQHCSRCVFPCIHHSLKMPVPDLRELNIFLSHSVHFAECQFAPSHFAAQVSDLKGLQLCNHSTEWFHFLLPYWKNCSLQWEKKNKEGVLSLCSIVKHIVFQAHDHKFRVAGGHFHEYQHEIEYLEISRTTNPRIMENWIWVISLWIYFKSAFMLFDQM